MRAILTTRYGAPDVLEVGELATPRPGPGQIRIDVELAGVGPTDLAIRAGRLTAAFPLAPGGVLGFEAAGTVGAVGAGVTDAAVGDAVAAFLPGLGGYAESVLADLWVPKPAGVAWADAAALPASGEAAARVLDHLGVEPGETLLVLGGAGAVGTIATQLAVAAGVRVTATVRGEDFAAVERLGAVPVDYTAPLAAITGRVDAVLDATGRSDLEAAVRLAGGPQRVVTLSDHRGPGLGVVLSGPDPVHARARLRRAMTALAGGTLALRPHVERPLGEAARVHAELERGELRAKVLLRP
ncbi:alcohol dehydrogenase catalytic domain-containing protein [Dactylosporangium matsuzakiense]|uniref:NADPH:quinone reductase n=1 Tax=Dactylosporangium matsuzakiense TaxID=53360 RepID=A0A9W6KWW5_9ACTN|nr:alcohol dehydrogenase catalytic domain-containing protein [Dactylosporangium matsuzakiense]UWZ42438.1 alcohol dehydrogenase catalytic domain-containing protein [Dactylosporangium matsuzakiense]GLL08061.1 NADPH:quinone reductase [Dactylosporangium matsuzakiense]